MPNSENKNPIPENKIPNFRKVLKFDEEVFSKMMEVFETANTLSQASSAIDDIFIENTFTEIL